MVLDMTSTIAIEDIYTLTLASIKLNQSGGLLLKEGFMQVSHRE